MEADLADAFERLDQLYEDHLKVGEALCQASPDLWMFDLLTVASLNRSMCLLKGFRTLVKEKNLVAAVPLLRIQIDTYLRYSASTIVANAEDFASQILSGKEVRHLRDRDGRAMTDRYLVERFAEKDPWIEKAYEIGCSYVHLSGQHYRNAMTSEQEGRITMKVGDTDKFVPLRAYVENVEVFSGVTSLLLMRVNDWVRLKSTHPGPSPMPGND